MKNGIFFGIGVGPGDPELLTVKAIHAIRQADVLIAAASRCQSRGRTSSRM